MNKKLATNKVLWIFAIGQLGWSILSGIVTNWLVFFYQPTSEQLELGQIQFIQPKPIFLGLTIIGLISAVGRIFDAVTDPMIAGASDRCKHKDGRRIPFMRTVAIPFALVTVLLFVSPIQGTHALNSACLFIFALLFYFCMTVYCTPYNALIPELGRTAEARINLSTFISVTYFLGTAFAYLIPNIAGIFIPSVGYANGYRITIAILACIAAIAMMIPTIFIKEADYADTTPSESTAFSSLLKTFKNKEFRTFVGSDILYWIALTLFQTGLPFYITVLMGLSSDKTFLLFAAMTGTSLIFYAPVNILSKKLGKKVMVTFAFFFFAGVFALTSLSGMLKIGGMAYGFIIAVLAAIPMAILGILPQAVVADIAEADKKQTGESREGMFYAARTFAFKLGQSVAMLLFTSISLIGSNGFGYRLTAIIAAVLCLGGAIVFLAYHESKISKIIQK